MSADDRRRILLQLFGSPRDHRRWFRFSLMLALSVVIATVGLSADSPALVIGAMLIAPLMIPVMAFGAAVALGWPRHMIRFGIVVLLASGGVIALAALLGLVLPDAGVTNEVLSRSEPRFRDLLVALAAGAAGAYATAREDVSTALPGVAAAVALVPPLAVVGYTLRLGEFDLAEGAGLLYVANLAGIVLMSLVLLVAVGFLPAAPRGGAKLKLAGRAIAVVCVTAAIGVPLGLRSAAVARQARTVNSATEAVDRWLGSGTSLELAGLAIAKRHVTVDLVGPEAPPPSETLAADLSGILGAGTTLSVRWLQRTQVARNGVAGEHAALNGTLLRSVVRQWLVQGHAGSDDVLDVKVDGQTVTVDVAGDVQPPSSSALADKIEAQLGAQVAVSVRWTEGRSYSSAGPDELTRIQSVAEQWAQAYVDLDVLDVKLDGQTVVIDLAGAFPPANSASLTSAVRNEIDRLAPVRIRFVERQTLTAG